MTVACRSASSGEALTRDKAAMAEVSKESMMDSVVKKQPVSAPPAKYLLEMGGRSVAKFQPVPQSERTPPLRELRRLKIDAQSISRVP